jgi:hypothetical protein
MMMPRKEEEVVMRGSKKQQSVLPTISLRCCETSLEKEGEECAD